MSDPKYAYPYPPQGYYQGPPVTAHPQYAAPPPGPAMMAPSTQYIAPPPTQYAAPPPRRVCDCLDGFLGGLKCYCLAHEYCCDPSIMSFC